MAKQFRIYLTPEQRAALHAIITAGTGPARRLTHARILLKADQSPAGPGWPDGAIAEAVEVSVATVERVRKQFATEGVEVALRRRPARNHKPRTFDGRGEAHLIALACSEPPEGRDRWTLRLLAAKAVELEYVPAVSYETVRQTLKKTTLSRG
jgi:hypothetical protein